MRRGFIVCMALAPLLVPAPVAAAETPDDPSLVKVFRLVNKARAKPQMCGSRLRKPVDPVRYDEDLAVASQSHAQDMADGDYFSHDSADGRTFTRRIKASQYAGSPAGENIAMGQQTAKEVVRAWLTSPPHCRNLMNRRFDAVGLGLAARVDPRYSEPVTYWVQDFGYDD